MSEHRPPLLACRRTHRVWSGRRNSATGRFDPTAESAALVSADPQSAETACSQAGRWEALAILSIRTLSQSFNDEKLPTPDARPVDGSLDRNVRCPEPYFFHFRLHNTKRRPVNRQSFGGIIQIFPENFTCQKNQQAKRGGGVLQVVRFQL